MHFLDVGQGDSTLILCGAEAMLIDAGDNDQGTRIQNSVVLRVSGLEYLPAGRRNSSGLFIFSLVSSPET